MKKTRILCLLLVLVMCVAAFAACGDEEENPSEGDNTSVDNSGDESGQPGPDELGERKEYTYKSYDSALGTNWNPHTWEMNSDDLILSYVSSPFCTMSIKDSVNGEYQWVFEMATSIEDVTKDHKDDLTKYKVDLQPGKTADNTEDGYVYEIKLNPDAKWENGEKITADDYIYSMQQLLDSKMRNYRANLYWGGESAVAGGLAFYNSEAPIYATVVPAYGEEDEPDYSFDLSSHTVYINLTSNEMTLAGYSFNEITYDYGYCDSALYEALAETANAYGYIEVTDENKEDILTLMDQYLAAFGLSIYADDEGNIAEDLYMEFLFYFTETYGDKVEYDAVGCYKVDDYTIRYVCQYHINRDYFLTSCTSTWLVYKDLYEAGKEEVAGLIKTNYGTSKETTMSYGTYKIDSYQDGKQIIFSQNENWYGFEKLANGALISYTNFEVDGEKVQQYQATKIIIDVMKPETAKLEFLKGNLTEWSPEADDLIDYATSDFLYRVDETYTQSFFFHTNVNSLKTMDESKGNKNSVVISNTNFRKALSLAFNRDELVKATAGYKPAYATMNSLYFYNVYEDPTSSYRNSDEAMQAICNVYGVEYGEGTPYATLKDAYDSINGYNLTEAKALMKKACEELVADGLYTAGEEIYIRIGWAKGSLTTSDQQLVTMLNEQVNAALDGSGFGKITFEAIDNIENRYSSTASGDFAIGYGAWGGAAFYPFRNFQVYMDPDSYDIHEAGCWDPTKEEWTLVVDGKEVTMTCQAWSNALVGNGQYATAGFETQLSITAQLEEKWLETYYRIPLYSTTACFLMSRQVSYYTEEYNIMYDFGGLRLMKFNLDDEEWAKYVSSQGGELDYK
ncbi:MAG: hypothetical protein J1E00_06520 [Oscillospiraceae bacterium]|nr:hypothetical protein [Oscillospiraceae bacterium]